MNRKQILSFAGKLHKFVYMLEQDAKRFNVSGHPASDEADDIRTLAALARSIAQRIEAKFG